MGKLAEAYVDVIVNEKGLDKGLASSKAKIGGFLSAANATLGRLGFYAATAGIGAAGAAMVAAARKASDLGESVSKVDVTFGKGARHIHATADDLAKQFGVVRRESLDAGASFGLMGLAAGMSQEEAAKLGSSLTRLGVDLASYHNLSNEEAFLRLRSGLAGEAEPLRRLGILLSEDAVKAQALAMGIGDGKRELTEMEKVRARIALIDKQAGAAHGDRARTAGSTANLMKQMQGELENAATDFGQELQGALRGAIKLAHELGDIIRKATGKDAPKAAAAAMEDAVNMARLLAGKGGMDSLSDSARLAILKGVGLSAETPGVGPAIKEMEDRLRKQTEKLFTDEEAGKPAPRHQEILKKAVERWNKEHGVGGNPRDKTGFEAEDTGPLLLKGRMLTAMYQEGLIGANRPIAQGIGGKLAEAVQALSTNKDVAKSAAGNIAEHGPFGRLLALGLQGGAALRQTALGNEQERIRQRQPSQLFSGEGYAQYAIQSALSGGDPQKELVKLEEKANETLNKIAEGIQQLIGKAASGASKLIPRFGQSP